MSKSKMTPTQQALWRLVVEIGGDAELFKVHPNLELDYKHGIEVLTNEGVINSEGQLAVEYR